MVPPSVLQGSLIPIVLSLRTDPATLAPGVTHIDGKYLDMRLHLAFRRPGSDTVVRAFGGEFTPLLEQVSDRHLPAFALEGGATLEWRMDFHLAHIWDELVPGAWEVQVLMGDEPDRALPWAWSGSIASPPVAIVVEEAPPRRIEVRVPRAIHLLANHDVERSLELYVDAGDCETITVEARSGFFVGLRWHSPRGGGGGGEGGIGTESLFTTAVAGDDGSIDEVHEVEVREGARPYPLSRGPIGSFPIVVNDRTLWRRSYRVTFSAAEIDALRQRKTHRPP